MKILSRPIRPKSQNRQESSAHLLRALKKAQIRFVPDLIRQMIRRQDDQTPRIRRNAHRLISKLLRRNREQTGRPVKEVQLGQGIAHVEAPGGVEDRRQLLEPDAPDRVGHEQGGHERRQVRQGLRHDVRDHFGLYPGPVGRRRRGVSGTHNETKGGGVVGWNNKDGKLLLVISRVFERNNAALNRAEPPTIAQPRRKSSALGEGSRTSLNTKQ